MRNRPHKMLALLAFTAVASAPAAAQPVTWERAISVNGRGEINALVIADNGDIIVAGFAPSVRGTPNPWVARFTPTGESVWTRQYGAPVREEAQDLALADDGAILVGGIRYVQPMTGNATMARLSPQGDLIWNKSIADPAQGSYVYQVEHAGSGAAIAVGGASLPGQRSRDASIIKRVDADGTVVWTFGPRDDATYPADPLFESFDGFATRRPDGDLELHDATRGIPRCVVIGASDGKLLPAPCLTPPIEGVGFSGPPREYRGGATKVGADGDPYMRRYDYAGRLLWERVLHSPEGDGFRDAAMTPEGAVIAVGYRNAAGVEIPSHELAKPGGWHKWDALLVKFDSSGEVVWRRTIGGELREELRAVAVLPDGSIVAAGNKGLPGEDWWSPWIIRLDENGQHAADAGTPASTQSN